MKELPKRYICEHCGYINIKDYLVCPACQNGKGLQYDNKENIEEDK